MNRIDQVGLRLDALRRRTLTVPEAAMVFEVEPSDLRHAVSRGMLAASTARRGGRSHRLLTVDGVMRWAIVRPFGAGRVRCREAVAASLDDATSWTAVGNHVAIRIKPDDCSIVTDYAVHLDEVLDRVSIRLEALDALHRQVETRRDGDPVIRGTAIEVHRIAALLAGGAAIAEVLRDFPSLDDAQVRAAASYARAYPKPGRPYPARSAKAALRAGRGGLRRAVAAAGV